MPWGPPFTPQCKRNLATIKFCAIILLCSKGSTAYGCRQHKKLVSFSGVLDPVLLHFVTIILRSSAQRAK